MSTTKHLLKGTLQAIAICAAVTLAGCEADGHDPSGISSGDLFPNDGTTPGRITDGGPPNGSGSHDPISGNFICTKSVREYGDDPDTFVATGGLVGGPLTALLNSVGGAPVTALLNSVSDTDLAIDGDLETFSTFRLTAGLLAGVIDSVDQVVVPETTVSAGNYAVFGVTFPGGTLELTLLDRVRVTTFRNDEVQETAVLTTVELDLLRATLLGGNRAFIGLKTTKSYDAVSIGIRPALLSANIGDALHVHELCTKGRFKNS